MSTEILPCPFCGSRCASRGTSSAKWVYCTDDDVCGYVSAERPAAIEAHNEIAAAVRDHAAVVAERNALRAQVAQLEERRARANSDATDATALAGLLKTRVRALEAQVAQLRDALDGMAGFVGKMRYGQYYAGRPHAIMDAAQAALAATAPKEASDA